MYRKKPFLGVSFLMSRQGGDGVRRALRAKNNENPSFIEKRSKIYAVASGSKGFLKEVEHTGSCQYRNWQ